MRIKIGKLPKMLGFRPLFSDFSQKSDKIGFFREIFRKSENLSGAAPMESKHEKIDVAKVHNIIHVVLMFNML